MINKNCHHVNKKEHEIELKLKAQASKTSSFIRPIPKACIIFKEFRLEISVAEVGSGIGFLAPAPAELLKADCTKVLNLKVRRGIEATATSVVPLKKENSPENKPTHAGYYTFFT